MAANEYTSCPYCKDHENRLIRLEKGMEECQSHIKQSSVTVAIISLIGALITAATSFASYIIVALAKSKGWL